MLDKRGCIRRLWNGNNIMRSSFDYFDLKVIMNQKIYCL